MTDNYELEFFAEDDGTKPVLAWIKNDLTVTQRRAVGTAMRRVLQVNGVGVCSSPWGRQLGGGLFEFRVRLTGRQMLREGWASPGDIDASERVLLRVFCHAHTATGSSSCWADTTRDRRRRRASRAARSGSQGRACGAIEPALRPSARRGYARMLMSYYTSDVAECREMSELDRLMDDIEREAVAEGPEAVARLRSLDGRFHVAGQLLALRLRHGITQRRLSELSGVQQADISRIERGETQPTTVTARRLADALGADFGFYEIDAAGKAIAVQPVSIKAA